MHIKKLLDNGRRKVNQLHKVIQQCIPLYSILLSLKNKIIKVRRVAKCSGQRTGIGTVKLFLNSQQTTRVQTSMNILL